MKKRQELVEVLKKFQLELESKFDASVSDEWGFDEFIECIEESILDIESEDA